MRETTFAEQRRLHLLASAIVARYYRRPLTLAVLARALSSSPRQLQRAYRLFGETTFTEELVAVRMRMAAQLLVEQPAIPVADVGRLVGYRHGSHFSKAFQRRYGIAPARFREISQGRGGPDRPVMLTVR